MLQKVGKQIDKDDFALLYECHAPALFAYLSRHTTVREDARDLLVRFFWRRWRMDVSVLWRKTSSDRGSGVWRAIRLQIFSGVQDEGSLSLLIKLLMELMMFLISPRTMGRSRLRSRNEEHARLRSLVGSLTTQQQQVLQLRFVHNLPSREIAQVMGKREGAVRMLLSRTLNLLHSMYDKPSK